MAYAFFFAAAMMALVTKEDPAIKRDRAKERYWHENTERLSEINERVAYVGALVSPYADQAILASLEYYESRFRLDAPDGDCVTKHARVTPAEEKRWRDPKTDLLPRWLVDSKTTRVCNTRGVTQISKALFTFPWKTYGAFVEVHSRAGMEIVLQDPENAVQMAYALLRHWKHTCGGGAAVWLTAYGQGKCPKLSKNGNFAVDSEGKRRCALAEKLAVEIQTGETGPQLDGAPWSFISCGTRK